MAIQFLPRQKRLWRSGSQQKRKLHGWEHSPHTRERQDPAPRLSERRTRPKRLLHRSQRQIIRGINNGYGSSSLRWPAANLIRPQAIKFYQYKAHALNNHGLKIFVLFFNLTPQKILSKLKGNCLAYKLLLPQKITGGISVTPPSSYRILTKSQQIYAYSLVYVSTK